MADFLTINAREMRALGWERPDFVYVLGDAYVDHPSFGHAIISRVLERAGYRVAMMPQPDWRDPSSVLEFGEPRLGFLVTGGNMDSMVNHYSVGRHRRRTDAYTPGGATGKRPDYATVVYCNLIRRSFPKIPILIGGIEASLRRLAHYDYWSDSLKRSILLDSQADLLLYGMGERAIVEVADAMNSGLDIHDITFVNGTAYRTRDCSGVVDAITLPSAATPRASPFSTATPIRFPPGASSSRTAASSWCRTRRSRRFPRRRWTTSTLCRIRTPITRPTARRAACPPSPRCSSASSRTAAASAAARSAR